MPLTDGFNITANSQADVKVIAFSDRYNGMVGGKYNFTNTSQYPYARLLRDEADLFSTFFSYDRLGRLVVSENTKQFNKTPRAYSYTLYDALGRITEVGEKAENNGNGSKHWASVFGTMVNNFFNPKAIHDSLLLAWINDASGTRSEVTHTFYDASVFSNQLSVIGFQQENLRKRVASVTYEDMFDNNALTYNHATHYSYDIHGNVNTLIQEIPSLATISQKYKRIDYKYDLISGKVNDVHYQTGQHDAFHHHYEYDADNRITQVYTSHTPLSLGRGAGGEVWRGAGGEGYDLDAKYFYYAHGPLARTEIGDLQVQGIDYAYTLQGWIKGVNSNILKPENDIGQDGQTASINTNFALDAFGYSLGYFQNDYNPIVTLSAVEGSFADMTGSNLLSARHDLYNGNISSMATTIVPPTLNNNTVTYSPLPQGTAYQYDQLNRLLEMQAYQNLGTTTANAWDNNVTYNGEYNNKFTYDANGNILTQLRKDESGTAINDLTYNRYTNNNRTVQNRLYSVNDAVPNTTFADDIDDQGTFNNTSTAVNTANNYGYDEIGNLKRDIQKQIAQIKWTVYGKIKELTRTSGSLKKNLKFDYDASGNRIAKHIFTSTNVWEKSEYYVRDAQGNVMSIYKKENINSMASFAQIEKDIYGSSRLGVDKTFAEMIGAPPVDTTAFSHTLGNKNYDGTNHLGNVLSTFTDRKFPISIDGTTIDHFVPDVVSANDYYPFGVKMKARSFNSTNNRYQFNGKEFDDETETTDYGARVQDGDLGVCLSIDPLGFVYPQVAPYASMNGNPITNTDVDGKLVIYIGGFWEGHDGDCYLELQTYWDAELQSNVARTLSDYQAVFFNGSDNPLISTAESRGQKGKQLAFEYAYYLRNLLDAQRKATGNPNEVLNFVSHSMGAAPSAEIIDVLSKLVYPNDYPDESLRGKNIFAPGDFGTAIFLDPYQANDINAPGATNNIQRSHTNSALSSSTSPQISGVENYKATPFTNTISDNPFFAHENETFSNADIFLKGDRMPKNVGGKLQGGEHNAGHNDPIRLSRQTAPRDNTSTPSFIPR